MKEWFLHYKEAIRVSLLALFRWTLLAVCTGVLCGGIGTLFHLAVEWVTEQRTEHVWLLWLLPAAGIAITALYKATGQRCRWAAASAGISAGCCTSTIMTAAQLPCAAWRHFFRRCSVRR